MFCDKLFFKTSPLFYSQALLPLESQINESMKPSAEWRRNDSTDLVSPQNESENISGRVRKINETRRVLQKRFYCLRSPYKINQTRTAE